MNRHTVLGVAREGWPVIAAVAAVAAIVAAAGFMLPVWVGGFLWASAAMVTLWAFWFFRDPERATPHDPGGIISGADGVVCFIGPGEPPKEAAIDREASRGLVRISVFMNIFNVHVNRAPAEGIVERIAYRPGRFFNASLDKASEHNERLTLVLRRPDGGAMVVVQIAGLIARRIVCRVKEGNSLKAGERFGLIRFGSRVDHYVPEDAALAVTVGRRVVAGETVLARCRADSTQHAAPVAAALQEAGA